MENTSSTLSLIAETVPEIELYVTTISLQGGALTAAVHSNVKGYGAYYSIADLLDLDFPSSGEPRTNAIAWFLTRILQENLVSNPPSDSFRLGFADSSLRGTVKIWLSDPIAYGHLTDIFDVMPACIHDEPKNQALRKLMLDLALYRNRNKFKFKIGFLQKEHHPAYKLALAKIPQHTAVLPTTTVIRKKDVRIIEGLEGLKDLGEKAEIGGNSLLLKTEHRHFVPIEGDDLEFLADEDEQIATTPPKEVERSKVHRVDRIGITSQAYFTRWQNTFGVFGLLEKVGIRFYGRFRDQDAPNPIEQILWQELENPPRISVFWGGSYGHKVGNQGPFDSFHDAVNHTLCVIGLDLQGLLTPPENYSLPEEFPILYDVYQQKDCPAAKYEYIIAETIKGLLKGSNLLSGKAEGLSGADVLRLENSIKTQVTAIFESTVPEPEQEAAVEVGFGDKALRDEYDTLSVQIRAHNDNNKTKLQDISIGLQEILKEIAALEQKKKALVKTRADILLQGSNLEVLKRRCQKISDFLMLESNGQQDGRNEIDDLVDSL